MLGIHITSAIASQLKAALLKQALLLPVELPRMLIGSLLTLGKPSRKTPKPSSSDPSSAFVHLLCRILQRIPTFPKILNCLDIAPG